MIDLAKEEGLTLNAARNLPELKRNGRRPDLATLYRWASRGVRGVVLETVQIGGSRCTTREAVRRFIHELTTGESGSDPVSRSQQHEQAEKELEAARI